MASDFRDLTQAQRETARALRTLTNQLRVRLSNDDPNRIAGAAIARASDRSADRPLQELVGTGRAAGSTQPSAAAALVGDVSQGAAVERALNLTTRALGNLDTALQVNSRALDRSTQDFSGVLQGLLSGVTGQGGGGGLGGLLRSGFGVASLGLRIAGLFRGSDPEPERLLPFELPPSLALEVANTEDILAGFPRADRNQRGVARVPDGVVPAAQPQVVVNISAMDTQSFLDRSSEVARAVRDAMLHMHPLNDVVGEI